MFVPLFAVTAMSLSETYFLPPLGASKQRMTWVKISPSRSPPDGANDPFDANFGFDGIAALVEEQAPALVRERLRASVAKTVASDRRVRAVNAIEVGQDAEDKKTRTLRVRVEVDTIASDAAAVVTSVG